MPYIEHTVPCNSLDVLPTGTTVLSSCRVFLWTRIPQGGPWLLYMLCKSSWGVLKDSPYMHRLQMLFQADHGKPLPHILWLCTSLYYCTAFLHTPCSALIADSGDNPFLSLEVVYTHVEYACKKCPVCMCKISLKKICTNIYSRWSVSSVITLPIL